MLLTLRAVLHWAGCVAGGAEFVHHACDVFHLPVDHSLDIVHVEQIEALQTTLQNRDLAPGVAQADGHPVQLHLREQGGEGRVISSGRMLLRCFTTQLWLYSTTVWRFSKQTIRANKLAKFAAI